MTEREKCQGIKDGNVRCYHIVDEEHDFCEYHSFLEKYTKEERNEFTDVCGRCKILFRMTKSKYCPYCEHKNKKQNDVQKSNMNPYCCWYKKMTKDRCAFHVDHEGDFCKIHQYVSKYSLEERNNVRVCSSCCLWKVWDFERHRTCHDCQNRSKQKNETNKQERQQQEKCKYCSNVASENGCCKLHQRQFLCDENKRNGIRCCSNFMRCTNTLPKDYVGSTCQTCRENDTKQRNIKVDEIKKHNEKEGVQRKCVKCGIYIEKDMYYSDKKLSPKCEECFEKQQQLDKQRKKRIIDWKAEYEKQKNDPKYIERVKKWKENNRDRIAQRSIDYRTRLINKIGIDEYHERMATQMRNYLDNHPEKREAQNMLGKTRVIEKYNVYVTSAKKRDVEWNENMTKDMCEKLFRGQCNYCGKKYENEGYLLGIDRINNSKGYEISNVVTCCKVCNYMKSTYSKKIFLHMCEYIVGQLNIVDDYDKSFVDDMKVNSNVVTYSRYVSNARNRDIEFELNENEFEQIISQKCYICGSDTCYNGVDRIDSSKSYCVNNCKACCKTCNYLKKDLDLRYFMMHLILIADHSIYDNMLNVDERLSPKEYNNRRTTEAFEMLSKKCNIEALCCPYEPFLHSDTETKKEHNNDEIKDKTKNIQPTKQKEHKIFSNERFRAKREEYRDGMNPEERKLKYREEKRKQRHKNGEKSRFNARRDAAKRRGKVVGVDVDENYYAIKK